MICQTCNHEMEEWIYQDASLYKCPKCSIKHIKYEVGNPVLLEDLIHESLEKFDMICKVCNQAMFMDWADHGGMMYKCQKCNNAQYKPKSGFSMNEPKVIKVVLDMEALNVEEMVYQGLKYSINNKCNVEFIHKTIKYSIRFDDLFLMCKEVK